MLHSEGHDKDKDDKEHKHDLATHIIDSKNRIENYECDINHYYMESSYIN